jgi:hypothetical protein
MTGRRETIFMGTPSPRYSGERVGVRGVQRVNVVYTNSAQRSHFSEAVAWTSTPIHTPRPT